MSAMVSHGGGSQPGKDALSRMLAMERLGQVRRAYLNPISTPEPLTKPSVSINKILPAPPKKRHPQPATTLQLRATADRVIRSATVPKVELEIGRRSSSLPAADQVSDPGAENEPPSPSICHSPTWSDRGSKERKREEKEMAKEQKELEKRLRKEEEAKKRKEEAAAKSKPRQNKKPPAAMDTQRMPTTLKQPLDDVEQSSSTVLVGNPRTSWRDRRRSSVSSLASVMRLSTSFSSKKNFSRPASPAEDAFMKPSVSVANLSSAATGSCDPYARSPHAALEPGSPNIKPKISRMETRGERPGVKEQESHALRITSKDAEHASRPPSSPSTPASSNTTTKIPEKHLALKTQSRVIESSQTSSRLNLARQRYGGKRDNSEGGYRYPTFGRTPPNSPCRSPESAKLSIASSGPSPDATSPVFFPDEPRIKDEGGQDVSRYVDKQRNRQQQSSIDSYREEVHISHVIQESYENSSLETPVRNSHSSFSSSEYYEAESTNTGEEDDESVKILCGDGEGFRTTKGLSLHLEVDDFSNSKFADADTVEKGARTIQETFIASAIQLSEVSLRVSYLSQTLLPSYQSLSGTKPKLTRLRKRGGQAIKDQSVNNAPIPSPLSPTSDLQAKIGGVARDAVHGSNQYDQTSPILGMKSLASYAPSTPPDVKPALHLSTDKVAMIISDSSPSSRLGREDGHDKRSPEIGKIGRIPAGRGTATINSTDVGSDETGLVCSKPYESALSDSECSNKPTKAASAPTSVYQRNQLSRDQYRSDSSSGSNRGRPSGSRSSSASQDSSAVLPTGYLAPRSASSLPLPLSLKPLPLKPLPLKALSTPALSTSMLPQPPPKSAMRGLMRPSTGGTPMLSADRLHGAKRALDTKPVAKMFVICCECKYWHDLPSKIYKAMVLSRKIREGSDEQGTAGAMNKAIEPVRGGNGALLEGRPFQCVSCPWCNHRMSSGCCAGWTTLVYLHERHH